MNKSFYKKYMGIMPTGIGALFFIQIFSTLSFSVLYSTLILYITNALKLSDTVATGITASFVAFNFTLHLLGGYAGGRFLSYRTLFAIGMIAQVAGCFFISIPEQYFLYWGLAAFLTGSGLNVTCINCMVTQLFQPTDKRRESAFLWNYSAMNIGFFMGFSLSGYFQLKNGYHELFIISSLGNLIALVLALLKWKNLNDINTTFSSLPFAKQITSSLQGLGLIVLLVLALRWLLEHAHFSNQLIISVGIMMAIIIATLASRQTQPSARKKMWGFIILAFTSLIFWTLYQLVPMGLMLFIERNVDRHYLGMTIPPQWVQDINTVVIIIGGPLLSLLFNFMRSRGIRITLPFQFSLALLLIGIAVAILPIGIYFADARGYSSFNWILISFILQSVGELFISPIGYAMVGQLAPQRLQGLLMGTWMMITGVAATLSDKFSKMALGTSNSTDPLITNVSYSHTFALLGITSIAVGVSLLVCIPLVLRLTNEKELPEELQPAAVTT